MEMKLTLHGIFDEYHGIQKNFEYRKKEIDEQIAKLMAEAKNEQVAEEQLITQAAILDSAKCYNRLAQIPNTTASFNMAFAYQKPIEGHPGHYSDLKAFKLEEQMELLKDESRQIWFLPNISIQKDIGGQVVSADVNNWSRHICPLTEVTDEQRHAILQRPEILKSPLPNVSFMPFEIHPMRDELRARTFGSGQVSRLSEIEEPVSEVLLQMLKENYAQIKQLQSEERRQASNQRKCGNSVDSQGGDFTKRFHHLPTSQFEKGIHSHHRINGLEHLW